MGHIPRFFGEGGIHLGKEVQFIAVNVISAEILIGEIGRIVSRFSRRNPGQLLSCVVKDFLAGPVAQHSPVGTRHGIGRECISQELFVVGVFVAVVPRHRIFDVVQPSLVDIQGTVGVEPETRIGGA